MLSFRTSDLMVVIGITVVWVAFWILITMCGGGC